MAFRPSSIVYEWCTNLLNREAPTTDAKANGFRAGEPVPPLAMNDLLGTLSDWVKWVRDAAISETGSNVCLLPAAGMSTLEVNSTSDVTVIPDPDDNELAMVNASSPTASRTLTLGSWSLAMGGLTLGVYLDLDPSPGGIIATSGVEVHVRLYDAAAPSTYMHYSVTLAYAASGTQTLAFDAASSNGFSSSSDPIRGPVGMTAWVVFPKATDTLTMQGLRVQFAAIS